MYHTPFDLYAYLRALSHFHVAHGLLDPSEFSERATEVMQFLHEPDEEEEGGGSGGSASRTNGINLTEIRVPRTREERRYLGKAHLREALLLHEEAMRVNRMCRELRKKDVLQVKKIFL